MNPVLSANRCVVGNCPDCGKPVIVLNDYEAWPLATCPCGWADATTAIKNRVRFERGVDGPVVER